MNCKEGAIQLIDQIITTIQLIPADDYAQPMEIFAGSTLGKHFRHIYDFFNCLVEQCDCHEMDYAERKRDTLIEEKSNYAVDMFNCLKDGVKSLNELHSMEVYADFLLPDGTRPKVTSTIGREIMYAYDHAVHHLAIVKIGLKALDPNLPIDDQMGVAASTLQHQYEVTHGH